MGLRKCMKGFYFGIHDTYLNEIKHGDTLLERVLRYYGSVQTRSCIYDILVSIAGVSLYFNVSTPSTRFHKLNFLRFLRKNMSRTVKFGGLRLYKIPTPPPQPTVWESFIHSNLNKAAKTEQCANSLEINFMFQACKNEISSKYS